MYGGKFAFQNLLGLPYFWKGIYCFSLFYFVLQAAVVQMLDSAIHRIRIYPVDSAIGFPNTYPLDSDLSGG